MWKTDEQLKNEVPTVEEHIVNFDDGSEKELPITLEMIEEAKHSGMLRNIANDIKLAVEKAAQSIKGQDFLEAGIQLERINNLADYLIREV
jgi:hypothetical protein